MTSQTALALSKSPSSKDYAVLQLICRFGLTTKKVASFFIDDAGGKVIRRMLEKKLIRAHRNSRIPAFTRTFKAEHEVLTLTEIGLRTFHQQRGQDIDYPEINPAKINYTHASHTLEGQLAIKKMLMHELIFEYETERMIDPKNKLGPKKFDLIAILNADDYFGGKVGIEIELSPKYESAMCETRKRVCESLMRCDKNGKPEFVAVYYFMENPIMRRYQEAFSAGEKIFQWAPGTNKKLIKGKVDQIIPAYLAARIFFFPIGDLNTRKDSK